MPDLRPPDPSGPPADLVPVSDAARRIGVCPETLYRLIRADEFPPAVHLGRAIRVSIPRMERWLHGDA
jgi:predicted DNA-binding transcriptional regulator AlpA